jgi:spore maturation protein CgeB
LIGVDFDDGHFFGATGRHPLAGQLVRIDREYGALAEACRADGVELVNLSATSRLTSLPRAGLAQWLDEGRAHEPSLPRRNADAQPPLRRVFCVHYRFLSCGTVFDTGLREAARTLGLAADHADWDDARLAQKIERFRPDLLFVVHGRRFVQRWGRRFAGIRSAVWLLDEPYEVDDTAAWSGQFDHVFVNDASTLSRHRHAHELPVAYAPALHYGAPEAPRRHRVGFIGGANPSRERMLSALARRGLLDYVVGGAWQAAQLGALCLSANIPAEQTAALYRDTAIVINVFRDRHHYNRAGAKALAMNPRICEALACGALVVSEPREDLARLVPELPTFTGEAEATALIERFLSDPAGRQALQRACAARLADATYAERLRTVMNLTFATPAFAAPVAALPPALELPASAIGQPLAPQRTGVFDDAWEDARGIARRASDGTIVIDPGPQRGPGSERGLVSLARLEAASLALEAFLEPGARLVAKLHLADRNDQSSNSYHLFADRERAYLARHDHVFRHIDPPKAGWTRFRIACARGRLSLWRDERLLCHLDDHMLGTGYAFVGAQGGRVRVRALELATSPGPAPVGGQLESEFDELVAVTTEFPPRLSIVTTVYDRVDCLRQCIASVRRLGFGNFEHLIVADHPPPDVMERIRNLVQHAGDARCGLYNLKRRHNNWGIAPAAAGLRRARGQFISFLSDDNGYAPDHFGPLLGELDRDSTIGFAYSSCRYDGRLVLSHPVPRPGRIDLGQPVFRRALFEQHFGNDLPFDMMAWDWHLVEALMRRGVRWRHINKPSFVFRLAKYPELMAP